MKISEIDKFELGTVSLFTGLAFITIVPVIMNAFLIYIEPNFFRVVASFFMLFSAIFYYLSSTYYKKQLLALGISLIIVSLFQLFFSWNLKNLYSSNIIALILGITLIIISIHLEKNNN